MAAQVTIIDYGLGNLLSVIRACEHHGLVPEVTSSAEGVAKAQHLVLPGVGAFGRGIQELRARSLVEPIRNHAKSGKPLLGICLGMQLLFDSSEELGNHEGLEILPGKVVAIPREGKRKVPHIGWAGLSSPRKSPDGVSPWAGTLLDGLPDAVPCYFVHSFMAKPSSEGHRLADVDYEGVAIAAVVRKEAVWGLQFHPEKSGPVGLHIIGSFLKAGSR